MSTAPPALDAAQQEFVEEACLMETRHVENLESISKFGLTFFSFVSLFLVTAWSMNLLNQKRTTQQVFLAGYTFVGLLCFLMAKKQTSIHRHRGMGFKILVAVGVWMWLASILSAATGDHQWVIGFQLLILAVTAIMVLLSAVFIHKFHRQEMGARMHKISQMLKRQ